MLWALFLGDSVAGREVRCNSCGALNRVAAYSVAKIPQCGKCAAALPEAKRTKALRFLYRNRLPRLAVAMLPMLGLLMVLVALANRAPTASTATNSRIETKNTRSDVSESCLAHAQPRHGSYQIHDLFKGQPRLASLTVYPGGGSNYFLKIEEASTKVPAMSVFIRGGEVLSTQVPEGRFIVKAASGQYWCGQRDLFGSQTTTGCFRQTYPFSDECTAYSFDEGDHWTFRLLAQKEGNMQTKRIPRNEF